MTETGSYQNIEFYGRVNESQFLSLHFLTKIMEVSKRLKCDFTFWKQISELTNKIVFVDYYLQFCHDR